MEQLAQEYTDRRLADALTTTREMIKTALQGASGLILLHEVLKDEAGQTVLSLLKSLTTQEPQPEEVAIAYTRAYRALVTATQQERLPVLHDSWQAYVIAHLIEDSNLWNTQIEGAGKEKVTQALRAQAQRDLRALQRLAQLDATSLWEVTCAFVTPTMPVLREAWTPWYDLINESEEQSQRQLRLVEKIVACQDWAELVAPLEEYWSQYGTGKLAHYRMLCWQAEEQSLTGINHPDTMQLNALIGYERQKERLTTNIERFLGGLPAHNMLLYGAPGTGKSSTIKALVNTYAEQGLRLVELHKEDIKDLPRVSAQLRGRAPHFLIFIDDLSFEEHETAYKMLKVLLEGTAETRPANVLICATTNRINLIRESFSERGKPADDVNWRDTMDEKQSLVHRFGLRVTFYTPDQEQYLQIVEQLARQRGLIIATERLRAEALQWERQHTGRSGRQARRFMDEMEAREADKR